MSKKKLTEAQEHALDLDGDGHAGGSLPHDEVEGADLDFDPVIHESDMDADFEQSHEPEEPVHEIADIDLDAEAETARAHSEG